MRRKFISNLFEIDDEDKRKILKYSLSELFTIVPHNTINLHLNILNIPELKDN